MLSSVGRFESVESLRLRDLQLNLRLSLSVSRHFMVFSDRKIAAITVTSPGRFLQCLEHYIIETEIALVLIFLILYEKRTGCIENDSDFARAASWLKLCSPHVL